MAFVRRFEEVSNQETTVDLGGPTGSGMDAADAGLPRGSEVGRYAVLERVGTGGMGEVYAAFDPELDRRVALKILLRSKARGVTGGGEDELRLLREAQAMAKLTHPNVLAVYDAGTVDGRVFIAMEFVEGQTLKQWLRQSEPGWREALVPLMAAGRGLAAAHAAGIIHRDFKPANVMLRAEDGEVRVLDFGLARRIEFSPSEASASISHELGDSKRSLDDLRSRTGSVSGTPAYMAPEQFRGATIDARTDQFSFCIALHEAVYGLRPFSGRGFAQLAATVHRGRIVEPPPGSRVPQRLRRVILRGLSVEPEDRFRDMDQLLAALQRAATPMYRHPVALAGFAVAGIVGVGSGMYSGQAEPPCPDPSPKLDGIWDAQSKAQSLAAFEATGVRYADTAHERAAETLDAYAGAWLDAHRDACEATHVRHEQSETLLDRRMACLQHRHAELKAVSELFADADAQTVEKAVATALGLGDLGRCSDAETLTAAVPPPEDPQTAAAVETIRVEQQRLEVLKRAGKIDEGLAIATDLLERARATGYGPVIAEALVARGMLLGNVGAGDDASKLMNEALMLAVEHGHTDLEFKARVGLIAIDGYRRRQFEEGHRHAEFARALRRRVRPQPQFWGTLEISEALVLYAEGKPEDAVAMMDDALAIKLEHVGPDHPDVAGVLSNRGAFLMALSRMDEAVESFERSIEVYERSLGPMHPQVAMARHNLGLMFLKAGDFARARELIAGALEAWKQALPADHVDISSGEQNLGIVETLLGNPQGALPHLQRALEIKLGSLGPDDPAVGLCRNNIATVYNDLGRFEDALKEAEQARREVQPLGDAHFGVGQVLDSMARAQLGLQRYEDAARSAEEALAVFARAPSDPADVAHAKFSLAQAARGQGDATRARELGEEALALLGARGPYAARQVEEVEAFLAAH